MAQKALELSDWKPGTILAAAGLREHPPLPEGHRYLDEFMDDAQKTQAEYDGKIAEAETACQQIIATGRKINLEAGQKVMSDAQRDAEKLLSDARGEAAELKARALDDAKTELADAAVDMNVAEAFTGKPGRFVPLKDTIRSFRTIVDGEVDDLPEQAFFMTANAYLEDREQTKAAGMNAHLAKPIDTQALYRTLSALIP